MEDLTKKSGMMRQEQDQIPRFPSMNMGPKILFAVEPDSERCSRWLGEAIVFAVRLYWELFVSWPVTLFSVVFAVMAIAVGIIDICHYPSHFWHDAMPIGFSVAFLAFRRLRAFVWALIGCLVGWIIVVALCLLSIVGPNYQAETMAEKSLLGIAYLFPPFIAALYIDHARNCRS